MIKVEELKCVLGKMLSGAQSSFESMSHAHAAALAQAEAADKAKTARLFHAASQLEGLQGHLAKASNSSSAQPLGMRTSTQAPALQTTPSGDCTSQCTSPGRCGSWYVSPAFRAPEENAVRTLLMAGRKSESFEVLVLILHLKCHLKFFFQPRTLSGPWLEQYGSS